MEITLSGKDQQFLKDEVDSGRFKSKDEAIHEGLRLLQERSAAKKVQRERLQSAIQQGLASLDRGERLAGDEVLASIREKSKNRRTGKA